MNATTNMTAALADHPFFSAMPPAALRRLAVHVHRGDYVSGQTIFREGEPADRFFLLRRGAVKLDIEVSGRGTVDIEMLGCDSVLGWSWLFSPYQWHMTATATQRTSMLVFDAAVLRALMASDPVLGYEFMRRLAAIMFDRLQVTRRRLSEEGGSSHPETLELPLAAVAGPWAGKRASAALT